jgi:hypothetical protein
LHPWSLRYSIQMGGSMFTERIVFQADVWGEGMPSNVVRFERLMYLSLGIGIVVAALHYQSFSSEVGAFLAPFLPFLWSLVFGVMVLFIWLIARRHANWARWVLLIMFVAGAGSYVPVLSRMLQGDPLPGILSIIQYFIEGIALYLIFTGNAMAWFKSKAGRSEPTIIAQPPIMQRPGAVTFLEQKPDGPANFGRTIMRPLKGAGTILAGILVLVALLFFGTLYIAGLAWVSENVHEYLDVAAIIAFIICAFVLLPCAFFRATQKVSVYGLYISSVIFGASTWIFGFLATLQYWGVIGVFVGVIMGVVGIVPLGMLASAFHSDWLGVGQLALGLVLTYGARMTAVLLAARIDRDEAGIKSNSWVHRETRSPQATSTVPEWAVLSAIGIAAFAAPVVFLYFTHASGSSRSTEHVLAARPPRYALSRAVTASTGDYASDLGTLNGVIKTWGYTRDICVEQFPDMQKRMDDAYDNWREKYKPFLQEIALRFDLLMIEDAEETKTSLASNLEYFQGEIAKLKPAIKNMYSKDGLEKFRDLCERYSSQINGAMGNLEEHYPEHVETIRKVPLPIAQQAAPFNWNDRSLFTLESASSIADLAAAYSGGDDATALRRFRALAEQGNAGAQFNLGLMYSNGRGTPQNYAEASKWFGLAANQGNVGAQFGLGGFYYFGLGGMPQNYIQASKWFRLAAEQGNEGAQLGLGTMYANGQAVPKNYVNALMWFNLAAAQGNQDAEKDRKLVEQHMTVAEITEAQKLVREWKPISTSR